MRNVSMDSPFDPHNAPPAQYLEDDYILEKPCKMNIHEVKGNGKPLAGKMSKIGAEIIRIGSYKAKHMTTGNWDFKFPKRNGTVSEVSSAQSNRIGNLKPTLFNPLIYQPKKPLGPPLALDRKMRKKKIKTNSNNVNTSALLAARTFQNSPELDNINVNYDTGRKSVFDIDNFNQNSPGARATRGVFECQRSPERDELLATVKERRRNRILMKTTRDMSHEPKRSYVGRLDPIDFNRLENPSIFPNEKNEFMNPEPSRLMKKLLI